MTDDESQRGAADALADLERRVTEKFIAAARSRLEPDDNDPSSWIIGAEAWSVPSYLLQFPREQWVTYPNRRTIALLIVDRLLDSDLPEEKWQTILWLITFGGRERIA